MRRRSRPLLIPALLLGALVAIAPSPGWAGTGKCPASAENLKLGTSLPRVKAAVRERKKVVIVALGSSSTQGFGATAEANTYPYQMQITLARQFRRAWGTSPHRYLVLRRLERARRAIAAGESLASAAILAGFADQAHLTRQFKRAYGITPGRWRRLTGANT